MTEAAPLLQARGLACRRGGRWLFGGLDLAVWPGQLLHLRGANGAGKTSLLRVLAGVARPEEGQVQRHAPLLYLGHANALSADLSLAENLVFLAALAGEPCSPAAVQQALALLGLQHHLNSPVRTLSQGQRRRGALARLALPGAARLWLLDEPHTALDSEGLARLDSLLAAHAAQGGAVLLTCHHTLQLPGLMTWDLATAPSTPQAAAA